MRNNDLDRLKEECQQAFRHKLVFNEEELVQVDPDTLLSLIHEVQRSRALSKDQSLREAMLKRMLMAVLEPEYDRAE